MDMKAVLAAEEQFFTAAAGCRYHARALTILQGDDGDMFAVCETDLKDPQQDFRRWVGRGNDALRQLVNALLLGAEPCDLRVTLTVPFKGNQDAALEAGKA